MLVVFSSSFRNVGVQSGQGSCSGQRKEDAVTCSIGGPLWGNWEGSTPLEEESPFDSSRTYGGAFGFVDLPPGTFALRVHFSSCWCQGNPRLDSIPYAYCLLHQLDQITGEMSEFAATKCGWVVGPPARNIFGLPLGFFTVEWDYDYALSPTTRLSQSPYKELGQEGARIFSCDIDKGGDSYCSTSQSRSILYMMAVANKVIPWTSIL